jgi:hypothetical protein
MIKLPHWPEAPDDVLRFRAGGVVTTVLTYIVVRADHVNTAAEMLTTLALAMAGIFVFENSVVRLATRGMDRREAANRPTEVIPPVREWPGEVELAIAEARHAAMLPIIDRGAVVEPKLFTHEYNPLTPPHGIVTGFDPAQDDRTDALVYATYERTGRHRADTPSGFAVPLAEYCGETVVANIEYVGRHRLTDAQLTRERTGQFFGTL